MQDYLHYFYFSISFIICYVLIKFLIKNAVFFGLLDHPNYRKFHKNTTPMVGGLAIILSFFIIMFFSWLFKFHLIYLPLNQIYFLLLSSLIIILTGLIDDIKGISASNKFLFQIIAAAIIVLGIKDFQLVDWPFSSFFDSEFYSILLSIFYIVSILNAINLIDGLDALAGGISIIITTTFIILSLLSGIAISELYILFILLGSLFAFIFYNKPPAKTFLGDSGSLFIGWVLAIASLFYAQKTTFSLSILVPIMALGLPSFDVIFVMLKRFSDRHNYNMKDRIKSIFLPDNNHLHHLIVVSGLSKRKAIFILYCLTLITSLIALYSFIANINYTYGIIFILLLIFTVRYMFLWKIKKKEVE
tara:strand:- start:592 stop:1671 length:1080 start_codon:yes stop_codon:yes gene_type:complete